jgi:predicted cation transporter
MPCTKKMDFLGINSIKISVIVNHLILKNMQNKSNIYLKSKSVRILNKAFRVSLGKV